MLNPEPVHQMIQHWWDKLPEKFRNIKTDEFVIMPNHIHGIIFIVGVDPCVYPDKGEHIGSSLHRIIQWFKTMTTNNYIQGVKQNGWRPFHGKFWQRNYYEHIIRNEDELNRIREYIRTNPLKWQFDKDNPSRGRFETCPI
jgi:REP element-mobilizing transposase RayT